MKSENPARHFLIPLLLAVVIYAISYSWIEHRRARNGPWSLTFAQTRDGAAEIVINQIKLGLTNVQLVFPGQSYSATNVRSTILFGRPRTVPFTLPIGQCIFMDATFLPGTLTFTNRDYEIQLLPRVLTIDRQEHPWKSDEVITLPAKESR